MWRFKSFCETKVLQKIVARACYKGYRSPTAETKKLFNKRTSSGQDQFLKPTAKSLFLHG
jgi:hypothetical protein